MRNKTTWLITVALVLVIFVANASAETYTTAASRARAAARHRLARRAPRRTRPPAPSVCALDLSHAATGFTYAGPPRKPVGRRGG
jgi:hypothetical protein